MMTFGFEGVFPAAEVAASAQFNAQIGHIVTATLHQQGEKKDIMNRSPNWALGSVCDIVELLNLRSLLLIIISPGGKQQQCCCCNCTFNCET